MSQLEAVQNSNTRNISEAPENITEENFKVKVLENSQPVVVDFWADWCGPCTAFSPLIANLASDFFGLATVAKIDVDQNQKLAKQYNIRTIPTVLVFKDGEVVERSSGTVPASVLSELLQKHISSDKVENKLEDK